MSCFNTLRWGKNSARSTVGGGQAAGRGSGGQPPRPRPWDGRGDQSPARTVARSVSLRTCGREGKRRPAAANVAQGRPRTLAPHADGRAGGVTANDRRGGAAWPAATDETVGGVSLRRPRDACGDLRPARMAARVCRRRQAARRGSGRGRGTVAGSAPRANGIRGVLPRTSDGDCRGGRSLRRLRVASSDLRPAQTAAGLCRHVGGRRCGQGRPQRNVAAVAAGRPGGSELRADGRGAVSPQMSDAADEWRGGGAQPAATDDVARQPRLFLPRADSRGGMSSRMNDGEGEQRPATTHRADSGG